MITEQQYMDGCEIWTVVKNSGKFCVVLSTFDCKVRTPGRFSQITARINYYFTTKQEALFAKKYIALVEDIREIADGRR